MMVFHEWRGVIVLFGGQDGLVRTDLPDAAAQPSETRQSPLELRPLQARASLKLWVPGAGGSTLADQKDTAIDLANGFMHSLTLPLEV